LLPYTSTSTSTSTITELSVDSCLRMIQSGFSSEILHPSKAIIGLLSSAYANTIFLDNHITQCLGDQVLETLMRVCDIKMVGFLRKCNNPFVYYTY